MNSLEKSRNIYLYIIEFLSARQILHEYIRIRYFYGIITYMPFVAALENN